MIGGFGGFAGFGNRSPLGGIPAAPPVTDPIPVTLTASVDIVASTLAPIDISMTASVVVVAQDGTAYPGLATPQLDVDLATAVITLGTTMRASGTSPPVVLLAAGTGSLTFAAGACPGFKATVLSGALTFDLSFNSGSTTTFAAQTIPVGGGNYTIPSGTYAGMIITFPSGTYIAGQAWEGTVATLRSSEGNAYTFTQATASTQPVLRKAAVTPDGKDALFHVTGGAGQWLASTDAAVVALFANDPALTVFGRVAYTSAAVLGTWLSACAAASNDTRQRYFRQSSSSSGKEQHVAVNDASTTISNLCTTTPMTGGTAAHTVCYYFPGSDGGANIEVNATPEAFTTATANIGTLTPTRVGIGSIVDSAPTTGMGGYIYRIVCFNTALIEADRDAWFAEIA